MSTSNVPSGLGGEDEIDALTDRLRLLVADVQEEVSKLKSHLYINEEMDREWVRDRLNFLAYRLRESANDVDPGP